MHVSSFSSFLWYLIAITSIASCCYCLCLLLELSSQSSTFFDILYRISHRLTFYPSLLPRRGVICISPKYSHEILSNLKNARRKGRRCSFLETARASYVHSRLKNADSFSFAANQSLPRGDSAIAKRVPLETIRRVKEETTAKITWSNDRLKRCLKTRYIQ